MPDSKEIANSARKLVGAPWHHQGRSLESGIDCIGGIVFIAVDTEYITKEQIEKLDIVDYGRNPDTFQLLLTNLRKYFIEIPIEDIKEGDIVAMRMAGEVCTSHVATVVNGKRELNIIHSLQNKITIEESLRRWSDYITFAFRFKDTFEG